MPQWTNVFHYTDNINDPEYKRLTNSYIWIRNDSHPLPILDKFLLEAFGPFDENMKTIRENFYEGADLSRLSDQSVQKPPNFNLWLTRSLGADNKIFPSSQGTIAFPWTLMSKSNNGQQGKRLYNIVEFFYRDIKEILLELFCDKHDDAVFKYLFRNNLLHRPQHLPPKVQSDNHTLNKEKYSLEYLLSKFIYNNVRERWIGEPAPIRIKRLLGALGIAASIASMQLSKTQPQDSGVLEKVQRVLVYAGSDATVRKQNKPLLNCCEKSYWLLQDSLIDSWEKNPILGYISERRQAGIMKKHGEHLRSISYLQSMNKQYGQDYRYFPERLPVEHRLPSLEHFYKDDVAIDIHLDYLKIKYREQIYKAGLSSFGRSKSVNASRYLKFESNILPVLVAGLTEPGESLTYSRFLEELSRLGFQIGPSLTGIYKEELLAAHKSELDTLLVENQDLFEQRLILAGYGHRYSDAETEVSDVP